MDTKFPPDGALALLVDDQSDVLVTTGAFLESAGFEVVRASNGDEALSHIASGKTFALLVTDYAMPGLNGIDLAIQALERLPTLKVLIITGFPHSLEGLPQGIALLIKPFRRAALTAQLHSLFDSVSGSIQMAGSDRSEDLHGTALQRETVSYPRDDGPQRENEVRQRESEDWQRGIRPEERIHWTDVFQNVAFGVVVVDATSNAVRFANATFGTMYGNSVEELKGTPVIGLYAPAERGRIHGLYATADHDGYVVFEADCVRRDGSVFPSQTHITSVRGHSTEVLYRIVTVLDITSRRHVEAERDQGPKPEHAALAGHAPSSPPLDCVAEGLWRIACGEACPDTWVLLAEQEKERWRIYATAIVRGWVTWVGGSGY